ncbi:hypothetical protein, partial [Leptospira santarosai]
MNIIRPRLNDFHNLPFRQEEVDFAIPFLDEDIPLYVDPFLLWKSPSMQDNSLHTMLANSLNYIGNLYRKGKEDLATELIVKLSECNEAGLGNSKTRRGKLISSSLAHDILNLYKIVPQISSSGLIHIEEIQLLTDNVSKDRISDLTCNFLKSF